MGREGILQLRVGVVEELLNLSILVALSRDFLESTLIEAGTTGGSLSSISLRRALLFVKTTVMT